MSEIAERLWAEYEAFTTRDLSEYRIVYLFVDGIAERLRAGQAPEPGSRGLGHRRGRRKVLLHLMAGSKEDTETVGPSSKTCAAVASATRCSSSRTGLQDHPGDRGVLPALRAATLSRASDAQPCRQGPD